MKWHLIYYKKLINHQGLEDQHR